MAAIWSDLWGKKKGFGRCVALYNASHMPPKPPKAKKGGKYPHLQPFNRELRSKK